MGWWPLVGWGVQVLLWAVIVLLVRDWVAAADPTEDETARAVKLASGALRRVR